MTSLTKVLDLAGGAARTGHGLRIEPTYWGYILPGEQLKKSLAAMIRGFAKLCGVSLVLAALVLWAVPGDAFGADALPMKLAMSSVFLFFGVVALQFGRDAGRPEVQIDLHRKEIRMVTRRSDGRCRLDHMYGFGEVREVEAEDGVLHVLGPDSEEIATIDVSSRGALVLQPDVRARARFSRPLGAR